MDFFETREKYRRREVHIYMRWLSRIFFLGLALWLGWQWGSLEQRRLRQPGAGRNLGRRDLWPVFLHGFAHGLVDLFITDLAWSRQGAPIVSNQSLTGK